MSYKAWYNQDADYNTNARSYMDYLARHNKFMKVLVEDYEVFKEIMTEEFKQFQLNTGETIDDFQSRLDNIQQEITDLFIAWVEDGTLETIIDENIFKGKVDTTIFEHFQDVVTTQLQQKASINSVWGMNNLTQEVKESMTGGSVAVVGPNMVSRANIVGNAVTTLNADFIQTPSSILNPLFTDGFYVSNTELNGGEVLPSDRNSVTDYQYIKGGVQYSVSPLPTAVDVQPINIAFYDGGHTYLGGKNFNYQNLIDGDHVFEPPNNTVFYKLSCDKNLKGIVNIVFGSTQYPNARYSKPTIKRDNVNINILKNEVTPDQVNFIKSGKNEFDYSSTTDDFYISTLTGNIVANDRNFISELTRVNEDSYYTISPLPLPDQQPFNVVFKNYNGDFIGGYQVKEGNSNTFKTPPNTYYIHFSGDNTLKDITQLEKGQTITNYEPYKLTLKGNAIQTIDGSNYLWLGDSMGANSGLTSALSNLLGVPVINGSFGSTTVSGHSDTNLDALSFKALAQALASRDFTRQETAVTNLGVPYHTTNLNNLKNVNMVGLENIVVFSGTNNYGGDRTPLNDMISGLKDGINILLETYPHLQFYFITPIYRGDKTGENEIGLTLKQYSDTIRETVEEYGFNCLDGLTNGGINSENISHWLKSDLIHLNSNGVGLLSKKIYKFISSH